MVGEVGVYIRRNPDRVRGADLAFWSNAKLPDGPPPGFVEVAPDLVVEILSPTDRWVDMHQKIEDYFSIGVGTLWIVDPDEETVFVYRFPLVPYCSSKWLHTGRHGPVDRFHPSHFRALRLLITCLLTQLFSPTASRLSNAPTPCPISPFSIFHASSPAHMPP